MQVLFYNSFNYLCTEIIKIKTLMLKKLFFLSFLLPATLAAQNFQAHYDFGKGREYVTTTFEMFKLDKWGNTFFFVDYDYNMGDDNHPSLAYMEIARCFTLSKSLPLSAQIEYNGGLLAQGNQVAPINNAFLAGVDYAWHDESFSKFLNLKLLYKNIVGKHDASFQVTGVWNLNFLNNKLTLSGFADFWREDMNFMNGNNDPLLVPTTTKYVFLTEPQFWYNVSQNFSVGSEVEIASNFGAVDGFKVCPTLALKWNF